MRPRNACMIEIKFLSIADVPTVYTVNTDHWSQKIEKCANEII